VSGCAGLYRLALVRRLASIAILLLLLVLGGALLFLFGRPRLASAHAVLIRSDPGQNARLSAQPANVDLFFSEPLNHSFSTVQVRNTSGQRLDKRDVHFASDPTEMLVTVPQIDPGYYTVTWTTVSAADGHRLDGAYPFTVLNPDGSAPSGAPAVAVSSSGGTTGVQPFDAVLRWLLLLGIIGVTGGFGFAAMVLYPAANELPGDEQRRARGDALWLLGAVVPAAVLVVVVMNVAVLVRQAEQNGSLSAISGLLSGSTGTYWIAREVLALIAGGIAWWLARNETRPGDLLVRVLLGVGLVIGLAIVLTGSLTSHAAATAGSDWSVPIDFLHVAAVSLWLGSLAQLPALLRMRRGLAGRSRSLFLGTALRHFSTVAFCCVGVVLFSGIFNGLVQVPNWGTLTGTSYGRTLIVKLVLLAPLLALAVWLAWGGTLHWQDLVVLAFTYVLSGVGITVGFHRLFSHRSFKAAAPVRAILAILVLHGWLSTAIGITVWAGALAGIVMNLAWVDAPRWVVAGVYVALGWVAVAAFPQLADALGIGGVALVAAGGLLYTVGAVVYARQRPDPVPDVFGYHEVFHALVIAAAALHFAVVAFWVL